MHADSKEDGGLPIEQAELVADVFRMLADSTRVRLLWSILDVELPVNEWPTSWASPRRRSRSTSPNCGWPDWSGPAAREPRSSTESRTTASLDLSGMRSTTLSMPAPAYPTITKPTQRH